MTKLDKNLQKIKEYLLKEDSPNSDIRFNIKDYAGGNFDDCFEYGIEYGRSELAEEILGLFSRISDDEDSDSVPQEGYDEPQNTNEQQSKPPKKPIGRPKKST